jgi:hypothetical protein
MGRGRKGKRSKEKTEKGKTREKKGWEEGSSR